MFLVAKPVGLFIESVSLHSYVSVYLEHFAFRIHGDIFTYRGYADILNIVFWACSLIIGLCACIPIYRNTPNISRALLSPTQADYVSCLSALIRGGLAGSFHLLVSPVVALPASAPHPLMLWQRILPKYYPGMHPSFDVNFRVFGCAA